MNRFRVMAIAALVLPAAACAADGVTAAMPAEVRPAPVLDLVDSPASPIRAVRGATPGAVIRIRCGGSISLGSEPLFVVNGRPVSHAEFHALNIDAGSIADLGMMNGPSAVALYGAAASNGVVLITLKPR
ncbi:hypothetical protein [Longimicrobium sp.]|uniref:hypothetical protein n=1 Tax=Longimicrobium sp. TaxID=2029185 RepID=UPI002C89F323|nr:hypothetical protein [Longimicrobium sp.]HSU15819.1 hypothetical protein [Longimicrobium sp.]